MIAIDVIHNRRVDVTGEAATVKVDSDKGAREMIESLRRFRKWLLSMPGSKRVGWCERCPYYGMLVPLPPVPRGAHLGATQFAHFTANGKPGRERFDRNGWVIRALADRRRRVAWRRRYQSSQVAPGRVGIERARRSASDRSFGYGRGR
jgi:hypothetical protein